MAFRNLSARITGDASSYVSATERAQRAASEFGDEATSLSARLQVLQGRLNEAGDELRNTAASATTASGAFTALSASSDGLSLSIGMLSTTLVGSLIPALFLLSTTLAPIATGFVVAAAAIGSVVVAVGSLLGAGLLAWGDQLADQMEGVNSSMEALAKVAGRLQNRLAAVIKPLGAAFVPLLQDAAVALPTVVSEMVAAVGGTEELQTTLRGFGSLAARLLPRITAFVFDLARQALPVLQRGLTWLMEHGPTIWRDMMQSVRELWPEVKRFMGAVIDLAPTVLKLGTMVAEILLPPLTGLVYVLDEAMEAFIGLPKPVRDSMIALGLLTPVITSIVGVLGGASGLVGVVQSLTWLLTGSSGLIAAISGSGGIAAALSALTGPIGIGIAAIGLLAAAWEMNLFDMRTRTKQFLKDARAWFKELQEEVIPEGRNMFGSWALASNPALFFVENMEGTGENTVKPRGGGPTIEETPESLTGDQSSLQELGSQNASAYTGGYMKELRRIMSKEFSSSFLSPSEFYQPGQQAGEQFRQGFTESLQGETIKSMTPAIMEALREGDLPGYSRETGPDSSRFEWMPTAIKPQLVRWMADHGGVSPEKLGVSQAKYQELLRRTFGPGVASAGMGQGSTGASPASMLSGGGDTGGSRRESRLVSASKRFETSVDQFARVIQELQSLQLEGRLTTEDGEIVALIHDEAETVLETQAQFSQLQ